MKPETWLDELAYELSVRKVGADDAMQAVVEAPIIEPTLEAVKKLL